MSKVNRVAKEPKADVFRAIADPTRRSMLQLLADQELPVTVISGHYPMTRTAVSKHLHILEEAGLLQERKVGRETRYSLLLEPLQDVQSWLVYFERFWDNKLNVLKHLVESSADDPVQD